MQYFSPFLNVDLEKMAAAFNTDLKSLEAELVALITENEISARIDSHRKVGRPRSIVYSNLAYHINSQILVSKQSNKRQQVYTNSVQLGSEYEKASRALLLRIKLMKADLVVKAERE